MSEKTGYLHPHYAVSLSEFGKPRALPRSGGWILERQIPKYAYRDGMGCYPLFSCPNWSQLAHDLREIGADLVSISLVTDPFGEYTEEYLHQCFRDLCIPFKDHFIVDLTRRPDMFVSEHHRRNARKALASVCVEKCPNPKQWLDEWMGLYNTLIQRHNIKGISAFSKDSFSKQFEVPGLVVFRAVHNAVTVGMILWYTQGEVSYYHLGAYSSLGYELRTSFGLFWSSIIYFADMKVRWLSLGAGAGVDGAPTSGLTRFKEGWATGTRPAYLCGLILDPPRYAEISRAKDISATDYFPAYRKGEFS